MPISKDVYRNRKANHLCIRCGMEAVSDRTLCPRHLQKATKNQLAMYDRRKANGQCRLCGQNNGNNRKICNNCLEKQVSKPRDEVWIPHTKRKVLGLCISCGEQRSTSIERCSKCSKKYYDTASLIRKQRIYEGLCGQCGKRLLAKNRKRCVICIHKTNKWYATSNARLSNIAKNQELKRMVIQHYNGKCSCCGETESTFLAIDHINGNGNVHRKSIKKLSSSAFYKWIINQGFPNEFQILCHNCNMSKYLSGGTCVHKLTTIGV